jgi:iron-sulfur cluster assembly accessory protein
MITITESAKSHLLDIMHTNDKRVRLAVKGGGCSGFTYDWQLVDLPLSDDEEFPLDKSNNLIVDAMSLLYLAGMRIDYKKDIFGSLLKLDNPNIKSSCGCGESFNVL